jgi:hypothetical protein
MFSLFLSFYLNLRRLFLFLSLSVLSHRLSKLLSCIVVVPDFSIGHNVRLSFGFGGLVQSVPVASAGFVSEIGLRPLPFTSLPIHYSPVVLLWDAM